MGLETDVITGVPRAGRTSVPVIRGHLDSYAELGARFLRPCEGLREQPLTRSRRR